MSVASDADTVTAVIDAHEFDVQLPCEHSQHAVKHDASDPAAFLYEAACSRCKPEPLRALICLSGWEHAGRMGLRCVDCGATHLTRDECWTILHDLRGR